MIKVSLFNPDQENFELPPIKSALKSSMTIDKQATDLEFNLKKLSDLAHNDKEMIELQRRKI